MPWLNVLESLSNSYPIDPGDRLEWELAAFVHAWCLEAWRPLWSLRYVWLWSEGGIGDFTYVGSGMAASGRWWSRKGVSDSSVGVAILLSETQLYESTLVVPCDWVAGPAAEPLIHRMSYLITSSESQTLGADAEIREILIWMISSRAFGAQKKGRPDSVPIS